MKKILFSFVVTFLTLGYGTAQTANFTYTLTNGGCSPDSVVFTNTSTGSVSYLWNFDNPWGDTSTVVNPYYIYTWGGLFTVQLIAYNSSGDSSVTSQTILIHDSPSAWFGSIPASWNDVCNGDEIVFDNQTWPGADSTHWFFGDGNSSYTYNASHTYAGIGDYDVTMISYSACGTDTAVQTYHVTNSAKPQGNFGVSPITVCPGQEVTIQNTSTGNIISYEWDFNEDGITDNTSFSPPNQTFTTTMDIRLITYNNCTSDTVIRTVTVDPTIIPTVWAFTDKDSACLGEEIKFLGSGSNLISYSWNFDDGSSSNQQNISHTYTNLGTYNAVLTATNLCGNSNSDTATVVIDNNATPDVTFNWSPLGDICPNTNVYFTNTSIDTNNYVFWDFGDGTTSTDVSPTHSYASIGNYDVKLVLENSCGKRDSIISTISVVDNATPFANYNAYPWPGGALCIGTTIYFENFSTDTTNCLWHFGDGSTSTLVNPSHTYTTPGVYDLYLTVTNKCGFTSNSWLETVTIRNDVLPIADFTIWSSPCPGEEIQLWNNGSDPGNSIWDFDDGITSTEINPYHTWNVSGSYDISLIATNACGSDTAIHTINIKQGSVADFISDAPTVLGNATTFTDLSTNSPDTWAWDLGDVTTSVIQNPTNTYALVGSYNVQLTVVKNGCMSHVEHTVIVDTTIVSINNINQQFLVYLFPNPNKGDFILELSGNINENLKLDIFNIEGQSIFQSVLTKQENKKPIHLKNVSSGIYFLRISGKEINRMEKIIIH